MPTLEWNKDIWDNKYDWELKGEEWSESWGNSEAQWFSSIFPRLHRYLGAKHILEIACGYGRWTKFLKKYAQKGYVGIDLSEECIAFCNNNIKDKSTKFYKNDGVSLQQAAGTKFDLVFSFDSLVHVNPDILYNYINQTIKLLSNDGVCFIHHSNFEAILKQGNTPKNHDGFRHFRDQKTSAALVKEMVQKAGGKILIQEIIDWGGGESIDCLTLFSKADSHVSIIETQINNNKFMEEANIIKNVHSKYCI